MTLRVSTAGMHAQGLQGLLMRQAEAARTQQELVTGTRLFRAADNPAAMAESQRLDHTLAKLDQYGSNAGLLEHRLRSQEQALGDVGSQLNRARELALQANNATISPADRKSIAIELRAIRSEILSVANRDDGAGRRLFAGSRDGVVPFADNGGVISYSGDDGRNRIEVAPDLSLDDTDAGSDVFLRVRTGDGTSRGTVAAGNTGSGVLRSSAVTDSAAWGGQPLRFEFTATDAYRVLDAGGAVVASGAYVSGATIQAGGVQVSLTGTPNAGDTFTVARAPKQDVFTTLQNLADALDAPANTPAEKARLGNALGGAIADISSAQDHVLGIRSGTGVRLALLESAGDTRSAGQVSLSETLSDLRDVDFAEAVSKLNLQLTAMEAAQKTMLRMQGLSLFDRL